MQHPVGYRIDPVTHRAELTSIWALLTNSTVLAAFAAHDLRRASWWPAC